MRKKVHEFLVLLIWGSMISCHQGHQEGILDNNKTITAQDKIEMTQDRFDIQAYNERLLAGTTTFFLDDGTRVKQFHIGEEEEIEYVEEIRPPAPAVFEIYKNYYSSGRLAESGQYHARDFSKGVWTTYDEEGGLLEKVDYDAPFEFDFDSLLAFIVQFNQKNPELIIPLEAKTTVISRSDSKKIARWYITWQHEPEYRERLTLNGVTGEVLAQEKIKYEEN